MKTKSASQETFRVKTASQQATLNKNSLSNLFCLLLLMNKFLFLKIYNFYTDGPFFKCLTILEIPECHNHSLWPARLKAGPLGLRIPCADSMFYRGLVWPIFFSCHTCDMPEKK